MLGPVLGTILAGLLPKRKAIALKNIKLCFPELSSSAQRKLLRKHFQAMAIGFFELINGWWASDKWLLKRVEIKGREYLEQAIQEKRGVILLGAHFTLIELQGRMMRLCTNFDVTYRAMKNPLFNAVMLNNRARIYQNSIHKDDAKTLLRSLKQAHIVWLAPDQRFKHKAMVEADFFGQKIATNPVTARLAKLTGARVVPVSARRLAGAKGYELEFMPPLEDFPSGDLEADTQITNQIFETMIRKAPEQYFWVHDRFK